MGFSKRAAAPAVAAALVGLAGCAADSSLLRDVAATTRGPPPIAPAPDFIAGSRPAQLDYLPVGGAYRGPATPARGAAETKAAEAELETTRSANEARGAVARRAGAVAPVQPRQP